MKITITHRNNKNQLLVSTKSLERFLERIVNDDAKNTVANFREYVPWLTNGYDGYKNMATWMHVHPAAEFQKSENGLLKMKQILVKATMQMPEPSIYSDFLFTQDASPYYREDALPLVLNEVIHIVEKPVDNLKDAIVDNSEEDVDKDGKELSDNIMRMIGFLCKKYDFRYNSMMKFTEYRPSGVRPSLYL